MASTIPASMKALVIEEDYRIAVKDHPVPAVSDDDILVKVISVAQNPTDWKHADPTYALGIPGTVLGCDFSGYVVKTGKNVLSPKVGDHVAGFVHGGTFVDSGAFAQYVKTPAELAWVVPDNTLTHDEAATLGCAFWTAAQALFHPTRLGLVEPPAKADGTEWVFVYGGSSAVGHFAVQLAHLAGYKVVSTASPRNFALVRSLGADAVFDYRDPDVVAKIKEATGDSLTRVLDAIAEKDTQRISAAAIAPGGGKLTIVLYPEEGATDRTDLEIYPTLLYTALGVEFPFGPTRHYPAAPADRAHMVQFLRKVPQLVQARVVRPPAIRHWQGGLGAIPGGLQYMREGNVSAEKIVHRIAAE